VIEAARRAATLRSSGTRGEPDREQTSKRLVEDGKPVNFKQRGAGKDEGGRFRERRLTVNVRRRREWAQSKRTVRSAFHKENLRKRNTAGAVTSNMNGREGEERAWRRCMERKGRSGGGKSNPAKMIEKHTALSGALAKNKRPNVETQEKGQNLSLRFHVVNHLTG